MRIYRNSASFSKDTQACVATIGNFDGLHLGHSQIIGNLKKISKEMELPLTVMSFEPLPAEYFVENPPARIYPLRDKARILNSLGVDNFLCLNFNDSLASMAPEDFVNAILLGDLKVRYLAVGDDFRFGNKRQGDFVLLRKLGRSAAMEVVDTPTFEQEGSRVSSTRIRKALGRGDIESANTLLGYRYQLSGRIRQGDKRGRTIGFPTINMKIPDNIAPQKGVYAVTIHGLSKIHLNGVANLGSRPTVNGIENRLETYIFNFDNDVYGQHVCIELIKFIRPEKRFSNFEQLKTQIIEDANQTKAILDMQLTS